MLRIKQTYALIIHLNDLSNKALSYTYSYKEQWVKWMEN